VLGAGGRAGALFHRGVVRAMAELGLDPRAADVIVGTSAGSLVGASLRRDAPARPSPFGGQPGRRSRPGRGAVLELVRRLADCRLDLVVVSSPMSIDLQGARPRADLVVRLRFRQFLRSEVWALRQHGLRVVTVEPDRATLHAIGGRMLDAPRGAQIEQCAHAHARLRLARLGGTAGPAGGPASGQDRLGRNR